MTYENKQMVDRTEMIWIAFVLFASISHGMAAHALDRKTNPNG